MVSTSSKPVSLGFVLAAGIIAGRAVRREGG